jgi:hypothetical protein
LAGVRGGLDRYATDPSEKKQWHSAAFHITSPTIGFSIVSAWNRTEMRIFLEGSDDHRQKSMQKAGSIVLPKSLISPPDGALQTH